MANMLHLRRGLAPSGSSSCWTPRSRSPRSRSTPPPRGTHRPGPDRVRPRRLLLHPGKPLITRPLADRGARSDHRDRGPHRRRQDHPGEPHHAVLRDRRRADPPRRGGHPRPGPRRAALARSAWCCRTLCCSAAPSGRTSATAGSTRPTRRSSPPPAATFVDRFVHTLPDGYDTIIEDEGANISAGERQLITIARAFLAEPGAADPRRGHLVRRHPHRGAGPGGDGRAAHRPHQLRDRPPPLHHPRRGRDPGDGAR